MAQDSAITPRDQDYSAWYLDVIQHGDLLDDAPVRGCKVLKPHGYGIWELIQADLDRRFRDTGHRNAYFPLFIPVSFLSREAEHVEGFAKECAIVTHHRLRSVTDDNGKVSVEPDPESALEEQLVVRPTSETVIWHMYGRWIDSWRDLPILINQWANVVRWEMRTRPFLRTAEFLWQEGHTAHATRDEAIDEARLMLQVYRDFAHEILAVPVVTGVKSARERFAGAVETFTIEALMQNGWALQSGTSHFLGQNFAKAFDVTFQNKNGERELVWATSWGVSTRLIGAVIMTHSDDDGLVLPPRVAPIQVVIIPVGKAKDLEAVRQAVDALRAELRQAGIRVHVDDRDNLRPGAKYFEWERKGVPLRLELGPRDLAKGQAFAKTRINREKFGLPLQGAAMEVQRVLDKIQDELLARAIAMRDARTYDIDSVETFRARLEEGGFLRVAWGGDDADEGRIAEETKATIRCFPLDEPAPQGLACPLTGKPAWTWALFARAY
ncbi:MAG: proline--tRNA ligase [Deltaproteobacteria bacterium]|nr:MAG: proline--tRNA ligase [Deltaproteobacteria bacterium]